MEMEDGLEPFLLPGAEVGHHSHGAPRLPPKERITVAVARACSVRTLASRFFRLVNTQAGRGCPPRWSFGCAQLFHGGGYSGKHDIHIRGYSSLLVTPGKAFCSWKV